MPTPPEPTQVSSLLIRRDARFACVGDGLCCSDVHVLGPVAPREVRRLTSRTPGVVRRHRTLRILYIDTVPHPVGGRVCAFLQPDGCAIHTQRPSTCRHFPFGLVATPLGLRVTTEHRCPCRSLGPRPALDIDLARSSLAGRFEQLRPNLRVGNRVLVEGRRCLSFHRFLTEVESPLLASLLEPTPEFSRLGEPFPPLDGSTWIDVAHLLRGYAAEGSSGAEAIGWFADTLLLLQGASTRAKRGRPWAWSFDRAEARGGAVASPEAVLGDWAADVLWSMTWTQHGSFAQGLSELATRLVVADAVAKRLQAQLGLRPDRAAAEAVMMAELAGALPLWDSVRASIRTSGQGTGRFTGASSRHGADRVAGEVAEQVGPEGQRQAIP
ncbi:MAG: YkgJ family cysteine cluster protein [Myxococcales bacterium]|nr:YkgJ family cysteine cluster protein [Polyangiaceae bacterium]MDW8249578.1 YkgJ family cysteine cluster protein [Myxococcales bacterium]